MREWVMRDRDRVRKKIEVRCVTGMRKLWIGLGKRMK